MTTPTHPAVAAKTPTAHVVPAQPGWTTTEFWWTLLTHAVAVVATVLALTGRGEDLSTAEFAIPVVALAVGVAYRNSRTRAKLLYAEGVTERVGRDLDRIRPLLDNDAKVLEPIVGALDPAALQRLRPQPTRGSTPALCRPRPQTRPKGFSLAATP